MNVRGGIGGFRCFLLGIDDQHAAARVALGLRGEEGGRQLPLAGAAQRIGLRIVGHERLRLRETFGDRARDAGEVVDLGRVEPHPQPGLGERVSDLLRAVAVGPSMAEEDVVSGGSHVRNHSMTQVIAARSKICMAQAPGGQTIWQGVCIRAQLQKLLKKSMGCVARVERDFRDCVATENEFWRWNKTIKSGRSSRAAAALVLAAGVSPRSSGKIMEPRSRGPYYAPPLRVMGWRSGGTGCETVSSGPRFRVPYISLSPLRFVTSAAKAVFYSGWLTRR